MHLDSQPRLYGKAQCGRLAEPWLRLRRGVGAKSTTHMKTLMIYLFLTGVHPTSDHLIGGCLMGVCLFGVYLTDVHITGVHLMA